MAYETILFEVEEQIATITLNRPEVMNAWNAQMAAELSDAFAECNKKDDVRAVVLTGKGPAFCAGADLSSGGDTFSRMRGEEAARRQDFLGLYPWQVHKPVLAAINGHAIGVGMTFAMSCDIRFVAEDAKVQFAFVRRGVIPELSSHVIVARAAGISNAADLLMTGRLFRGREMAQLGLATQALPAEDVLDATIKRAKEFLKAAPVSVAISKRLLWEGLSASVVDIGKREFQLFQWTAGQSDAREGVEAFLEKREPEWKLRVSQDLPELLNSPNRDRM